MTNDGLYENCSRCLDILDFLDLFPKQKSRAPHRTKKIINKKNDYRFWEKKGNIPDNIYWISHKKLAISNWNLIKAISMQEKNLHGKACSNHMWKDTLNLCC